MEKRLRVNGITLELSGVVAGIEDLIVGKGGVAIVRYVCLI